MKTVKQVLRIITNKYVIAIIVFAVIMLFVDRNNIFEQRQKIRQLNTLLASKKFYQDEIEKTQKNLSALKDDPAALEKYARETYLMKRDNEDLFIIDSTLDNTKK